MSPTTAPDSATGRPLLVALLIAAPVLGLVGTLSTGFVLLSGAFGGVRTSLDAAAQYGIAFTVAIAGPVALFVVARHHWRVFGRTGLRRAGQIVGGILAILSLGLSGAPFALASFAFAAETVTSVKPLSSSESAYTATELRELAEEFLADSVSELADVERPVNDSSSTYTDDCRLSNNETGTRVSTLGELYLTSDDAQSAIASIAGQWDDLGYDVTVGDDYARINDEGFLDEAGVVWVVRHESSTVDGPETYNVDITFTTICVEAG